MPASAWSAELLDRPATLNAEDVSRRAGEQAYGARRLGPDDIDFVEMHDCFTIAEIVRMEGLGPDPGGRGRRGPQTATPPRRPAAGQPSGGLLSRGHPVGATGVAQVCELYWQLRGHAGGRQVEGARPALAYCKGGTVNGTDGASVTTVVVSM